LYQKHGSNRMVGGEVTKVFGTDSIDVKRDGHHMEELKCRKASWRAVKVYFCPKCRLPWSKGHECAPNGCCGVSDGEAG